jgi:hypothetical protein
MTKLEIINETVEFYSADPKRRSFYIDEKDVTKCLYNGKNGEHCAVGRCLEDKYHEMGQDLPKNSFALLDLFEGNDVKGLDEMLKEQYRGHEAQFWAELQRLHDNPRNWTETGISQIGQIHIDKVIQQYKNL